MSIQTELTRLTNAKAAIQAAIEGKGVTVPDGTLLDGMASLIESIEAGGGDATLTHGTYTPSSETGNIEIEHGLGVQPRSFVAIAQLDESSYKKYDHVISAYTEMINGNVCLLSARRASSTNLTSLNMYLVSNKTYTDLNDGNVSVNYGHAKLANDKKVVLYGDTSFFKFRSGVKIEWFAKG